MPDMARRTLRGFALAGADVAVCDCQADRHIVLVRSQGDLEVEITEVRIKLMEEPGERLKAFCSITFDDCFVLIIYLSSLAISGRCAMINQNVHLSKRDQMGVPRGQ